MLAEIVKSVTGRTLRQFTDSAIFKPLGMYNTHFHDDYTEVVKNRSYSYGRKDNTHFANSILSYSNAGATSLFSNVNDMAKWIMNFYIPKAGTQKEIDQLTQKGKLNNNNKELPYALGIAVNTYKGWKQYSHSGGDAGYRTYITAFPDLKMGFIVFSNLGDFNAVAKAYEMADFFIKDTITAVIASAASVIDTSKAVLNDIESARNFSGQYLSDAGVQFSFKLNNQKLYWERYGRSDLLLKSEKDTFLVVQSPDVKFVFNTATTNMSVKQSWVDGERLLIKYNTDSNQTDKQLQPYAGTYYCPELDCKYGIVLKDKNLMLTNDKYENTKLKLIGKDDLLTDYWWMSHLKILRNNKNHITGFEVNDSRIMHLRFNKIE